MSNLLATSQEVRPRALQDRRRARVFPRPIAFWTVTGTTVALLAASSAPSPLYSVYQAEFGFSALTLTAIFAVYVVALLLSLLTTGRLSDHLGRRPVLAAALVVEAVAMAVFLGADGVAALYAARIVQGLATGTALGVVGAYLLDLQPPTGSRLGSLVNSVGATVGLGVGAAATGLLIEYAPHPTRLIFVLLSALFIAAALATAALPETVERKPGAPSLRPRVSVPASARRPFIRAVPTMMATWMLGGLMLSLGGSLLTFQLGQSNHAIVGLVLGSFSVTAAIVTLVLQHRPPETMVRIGTVLLLLGAILFVIAVATTSLALFVVGANLAGAGFGPAFLGAFRTVSQLAAPHERAGLISAIYVVSYLAFSIPALIAGVLITRDGLRSTSLGYGAVVGAVAAGTLLYETFAMRRPAKVLKAA
jgi:MFS family permease